jgi:hypothetical protein
MIPCRSSQLWGVGCICVRVTCEICSYLHGHPAASELDEQDSSLAVVSRLVALFGGRVDTIILRRVTAGSDAPSTAGLCINFHTDHAERTMQIPLNATNAYSGGRLAFISDTDGLQWPSRTPGSATVHNNRIVHGVTALTMVRGRLRTRSRQFFAQLCVCVCVCVCV